MRLVDQTGVIRKAKNIKRIDCGHRYIRPIIQPQFQPGKERLSFRQTENIKRFIRLLYLAGINKWGKELCWRIWYKKFRMTIDLQIFRFSIQTLRIHDRQTRQDRIKLDRLLRLCSQRHLCYKKWSRKYLSTFTSHN